MKILMRESEHPPRPRQPLGNADPSALYGGDEASLIGRNEGTVRFLFGPGIVGHGV
jgi:CTD kinase subunit beta